MHVYVIGAGLSGLTTAKHLLEEGFKVTILEKRDGLGGLWYFDKNTKASVTNQTEANSSKVYLQFSDFPMADHVPMFPHHAEYLNYLRDYTNTHQITPLIKFNCDVLDLRKSQQGWEIDVFDGQQQHTYQADGVAVCAGLHQTPLVPQLDGHENYTGQIIHSTDLKDPEQLKDKRVLVVGGGETAGELVHQLAPVASEVYMSLRKGMALTRHWYDEVPSDYDSTRAKVWLPRKYLHDYNVSLRGTDKYSPFKTLYTLLGLPIILLMTLFSPKRAASFLGRLFEKETWMALFKPYHRHGPADGVALSQACAEIVDENPQTEQEVADTVWQLKSTFDWYSGAMHNSQPFTKRFAFLSDIARNKIKIVPGVEGYTGGQAVALKGGAQIEPDVVVMCTGFKSVLPFYGQMILDGRKLYKHVFLPDAPNLAFIGFIRPNIGSIPAVAEMQARWFAGSLAGRIQLPNPQQMSAKIAADAALYTEKYPILANRRTSLVDYHAYMEMLAGYIGCRPQIRQLILKPKLLYKFLFGPMASYQYRLNGHGAKPEVMDEVVKQIPSLPIDIVLQHSVVYLCMKPWFFILGKLGIRDLKPVF